jgi:hypothetical protein
MGYMGFGMRKEVYTRKPKTSFGKIKEIYGDHLERYSIKKGQGEWSEKDKEDFKAFVKKKIKSEQLQESTYNAIIFTIIIIIVGYAIYLARVIL